ncbi:MAG: hypothetical protein ACKO3P_16275, partial [Planctomycetaceae bacterium]
MSIRRRLLFPLARDMNSNGVALRPPRCFACHTLVVDLRPTTYDPGAKIRGLSSCHFRNGSRLVVTMSLW